MVDSAEREEDSSWRDDDLGSSSEDTETGAPGAADAEREAITIRLLASSITRETG
jgi:hypothetical protein